MSFGEISRSCAALRDGCKTAAWASMSLLFVRITNGNVGIECTYLIQKEKESYVITIKRVRQKSMMIYCSICSARKKKVV